MSIDVLAAVAAWSLTFALGAVAAYGHQRAVWHGALAVGGLCLLSCVLTSNFKLYRERVCAMRSFEVAGLMRVALLTGISAIGVAGLARLHLPLSSAALGAGIFLLLDGSARGIFTRWLRARRASGQFVRDVILVGDNEEAKDLYDLTVRHPECGLHIAGVVGCSGRYPSDLIPVPWLGTTDDLPNAVDSVAGVIVAASAFTSKELNRSVRLLLEADLHIHLSTGLAGISVRRLRPLPLARQPMFYVEQQRQSPAAMVLKRIFDVVLAASLLILTAPILATAALVIKLGDRGAPVVYKSERVGRSGRPFTVYKLRTMVPDAAARLQELLALNQRTGPLFKLAADPRVTRVGRFLRQSSIDELPQLVNVLKGEMSIVGPRPALPSEVAEFDNDLLARQNVTPGITGLWQVEARTNPSFHAYRSLDLFYVENWSLLLDLAIMLSTVAVVTGGLARSVRSHLHRRPVGESLY
jgi:exopolysaccharide biosynthesis polyprenyl glycosylphosphotransferase